MDVTRVTSPPSIHVNDFNGQHGSYRATSKPSAMPYSGNRAPMTIPGSRGKPAPPPLPPPTHPHLVAGSYDLGWEMGNMSGRGGFGKGGGSVSSESSLRGNWNRKRADERVAERPDFIRRGSSISTVRSPVDLDTKHDFSRHQDEGYYSISETQSVNYQLHGARHLEQRNLQNYSQAYDNKLLSKFGKPETPPRTMSTESTDSSPTSSSPFYQCGKHPHPLKPLSMSDGSVSASPDFPLFRKESFPSRFGGSPQSRPISPGLITSATSAKHYMDYRSPTWDGSAPPSATDSEHPQRRLVPQPVLRHERSRRSGSGPTMLANVDESAEGSFAGGTSNTGSSTRGTTHHAHANHPTHFGMTANAFRNAATAHSMSMSTSNQSGSNSSALNSSEYSNRHKRGSFDQSRSGYVDVAVDPDGLNDIGLSGSSVTELPLEETGASALRQLHLEDPPPLSSLDSLPPSSYYFSSTSNSHSSAADSRLGMKRRASSPPLEAPHDDKPPSLLVGTPSSELYQRNTTSSTAHLSANRSSPQNPFAPAHSSVSSVSSSGLRNGSYASSNGLSVGSSITSISSSHDRLSPGGISPSSEQQHSGRDSPYVSSLPLNSSPQDSLSRSQQRPPPESKSTAVIARKMSGQPSAPPKHPGAPKIQAHVHICECCPKKPKKFDTLQELKNHESEKQYMCQFCHNRFKNKNEAERHQNSLHLRRHSWSCATLAGTYDAAFHTQTAISPGNNPNEPTTSMNMIPPDICGYCGEEFPNDPAPDWDARILHLTNVHKFGECNQSKKFFRADHFRQHLKHSHAGTSGKWTNMLETACMKDEPPITGPEGMPPQGAPIANMGIGSGRGMQMNAMNMGMPGMGIVKHERINEMQEEM